VKEGKRNRRGWEGTEMGSSERTGKLSPQTHSYNLASEHQFVAELTYLTFNGLNISLGRIVACRRI